MAALSIVTISQLNFYVKSLMDDDEVLNHIFLSGEISNLIDHYRSGHIYLSLKDDKAVIKCVMFAGNALRLRFKPENGMKIIASGRVSVYEATGQYQFYIEQMQPDGIGDLTVAYEQIKAKLESEGLFDSSKKQPLPQLPKNIGVITSSTGAARRDIEQILARRCPLTNVLLYPATVQGDKAVPELINAMNYFNNNNNVDVIIIGRGGGSIEDLWAFNDESLARTVANSHIPVISGVGHETDFTICDFAADMRAPTPSAAAELAVPDMLKLFDDLNNISFTLGYLIKNKISSEQNRIKALSTSRVLSSDLGFIQNLGITIDNMSNRLGNSFQHQLHEHQLALSALSAKLNVLSPLNILSRGYAIPMIKDKPVKTIYDVSVGDNLEITLSKGKLDCVINQIKE